MVTLPRKNLSESDFGPRPLVAYSPSPLGVRYMEYLFMVSGVLHSFPKLLV